MDMRYGFDSIKRAWNDTIFGKISKLESLMVKWHEVWDFEKNIFFERKSVPVFEIL